MIAHAKIAGVGLEEGVLSFLWLSGKSHLMLNCSKGSQVLANIFIYGQERGEGENNRKDQFCLVLLAYQYIATQAFKYSWLFMIRDGTAGNEVQQEAGFSGVQTFCPRGV